MKTQKFLSVLMSICIILASTVIFSASVTAAEVPTKYLYLEYDNKVQIYPDSYSLDNGVTKTSFVGNYFISGYCKYNICFNGENAEYNVTVHNLTNEINWSLNDSSLKLCDGAKVNLTAIGVNSFTASNHPGISGTGTVNLTVEKNSSFVSTVSRNQALEYISADENIVFNLVKGTTSADLNTANWKKKPLTVTNGEATEHKMSILPLDNGTHDIKCTICDIKLNDSPCRSEFTYNHYDDNRCERECQNCGVADYVPHKFEVSKTVPANFSSSAKSLMMCKNNCGYFHIEPVSRDVIEISVTADEYLDGTGILAFVDGVPTCVTSHSGFKNYIDYNPNSSYVFKLINPDIDDLIKYNFEIKFPENSNIPTFSISDTSEYEMYDTLLEVNTADYTALDKALEKVPKYFEYYSKESVGTLVTALKSIKLMLPKNRQSEVDAMTQSINSAVAGLVSVQEPETYGVINLKSDRFIEINTDKNNPSYAYYKYDSTGKKVLQDIFLYGGKYVIVDSSPTSEAFATKSVTVHNGKVDIDLVNAIVLGEDGNLVIKNGADVTLNLFGTSVLASNGKDSSGISVLGNEAKLKIAKSDGSVVAIAGNNFPGIGGINADENSKTPDTGYITIDGGTVFALSMNNGAGIGGGYKDTPVNITINGGTIYAVSFSKHGAGIGGGYNGCGGDIIINGGDIVALNIDEGGDDDGAAAIGGADHGYINSITINGGNILATSLVNVAVGGGLESTKCGKIIINGGNIFSDNPYVTANLKYIGVNAKYDPAFSPENENNFVQINGGTFSENSTDIIYPFPKNKDGNLLQKLPMKINKTYIGQTLTYNISNGKQYTVTPSREVFAIYIPENETVTNISQYLSESHEADKFVTVGKDGSLNSVLGYYTCKFCDKHFSDKECTKEFSVISENLGAFISDNLLFSESGITARILLSRLTSDTVITDINGKAVSLDTKLATGMKIKLPDGKILTVVINGDIDKNGDITAADARLALRISVNLEKFTATSPEYKASDVDGKSGTAASDARLILRNSVSLEKLNLANRK